MAPSQLAFISLVSLACPCHGVRKVVSEHISSNKACDADMADLINAWYEVSITRDCEAWSNLYAEGGSHASPPANMVFSGRSAVQQFCEQKKAAAPDLLMRQNGDAYVTDAGGKCHVLIPTIMGLTPTSATNIATGFLSMVLVPDSGAAKKYQIQKSVPFYGGGLAGRYANPNGACSHDTGAALTAFFSLFDARCEDWATNFASNASFYHPKAGHVQGEALSGFCSSTQEAVSPSHFRPDGPAIRSETGDKCQVLVPYVWYYADAEHPPSKAMMNSGWEILDLVPDQSVIGYKIADVAEVFTRSARAFDWSNAQ